MARRSSQSTLNAKARRGTKQGGDYSAVLVAAFLIALTAAGAWYWWPRDPETAKIAAKARHLTARHPDAEVFSSDIEAPLAGEKKK